MEINKLYINKDFIKQVQVEYKYQTSIDNNRQETLINDWNDIVDNCKDDLQYLYLTLARFIVNKFLNSHTLLDGNKRMHYALTKLLIDNFTPEVDLL